MKMGFGEWHSEVNFFCKFEKLYYLCNMDYEAPYKDLVEKLKSVFGHFAACYADASEKGNLIYKDAYAQVVNRLAAEFGDELNITGDGKVEREKHKIVINTCYGGFGLSNKAVDWMKERGVDVESLCGDVERHNPVLVACVEALGKEANDNFSDLAVIEIEGTRYRVDDYDGYEWAVTPDDSCDWVEIKDKEEYDEIDI